MSLETQDATPMVWCVKCGAETVNIKYDSSRKKWLNKCRDCHGHYAITNGVMDELRHDEVPNFVIARHGF